MKKLLVQSFWKRRCLPKSLFQNFYFLLKSIPFKSEFNSSTAFSSIFFKTEPFTCNTTISLLFYKPFSNSWRMEMAVSFHELIYKSFSKILFKQFWDQLYNNFVKFISQKLKESFHWQVFYPFDWERGFSGRKPLLLALHFRWNSI